MISLTLFGIAIVVTIVHSIYVKKYNYAETFLSYLLFFNMGIMGLLAAYAHVFMAAQTAIQIGWEPGSPFQFEIAMANLSYGVLGILAFNLALIYHFQLRFLG